MNKMFIVMLIAAFFLFGYGFLLGYSIGKSKCEQSHKLEYGIVKQTTDNRGLTSIVIREADGSEYAYDYLTKPEYDSILLTLNK